MLAPEISASCISTIVSGGLALIVFYEEDEEGVDSIEVRLPMFTLDSQQTHFLSYGLVRPIIVSSQLLRKIHLFS